jgi:hypothetical protein
VNSSGHRLFGCQVRLFSKSWLISCGRYFSTISHAHAETVLRRIAICRFRFVVRLSYLSEESVVMQTKRMSGMTAALAPPCLAVSALPAEADLLSIDNTNRGPNSIVRDTTTKLDWLKPIETINPSYQSINSQRGTGNYPGFHFASLSAKES